MPGKLKPIPKGKRRELVKEQFGFLKRGGKVEKMKDGGQARGMGAAVNLLGNYYG